MMVIVSEQYCVVRWGRDYYVCRRVGSKKQCVEQCGSYGEAYAAFRRLSDHG